MTNTQPQAAQVLTDEEIKALAVGSAFESNAYARRVERAILAKLQADAPASEVVGCFEAAFAEGLTEALAETQDKRLKDLVERRLMHALYAAQSATPASVETVPVWLAQELDGHARVVLESAHLAALAALSQPTAASSEVVAWSVRIGSSPNWCYCESESDADFYGKQSGMPYEKRPLYTTPPASQPQTDPKAEHDKAAQDALLYGMGIQVDGKHVKLERVRLHYPKAGREPASQPQSHGPLINEGTIQPHEGLWCIHIPGPGELHAAPSESAAKHMADKHNAAMRSYFERHPDPEGFGPKPETCMAEVQQWPWAPEEHAAELLSFDYQAWGLEKLASHSQAQQPSGGEVIIQPQATPFGALAKRRIFDAIRGAYDLGYNDARNAKAAPGDGAPGYAGRDVEADHGGALLSALNHLIRTQATPAEPAQAVPCEACGGPATHEVGPERTSFPGAYCDDCDPLTTQPAKAVELPDERAALTYEQWFAGEQGKPYDGMYVFGKAAWRAALSARGQGLVPLTDEQIDEIRVKLSERFASTFAIIGEDVWDHDLIRLAEAAHGINGLEVKPSTEQGGKP